MLRSTHFYVCSSRVLYSFYCLYWVLQIHRDSDHWRWMNEYYVYSGYPHEIHDVLMSTEIFCSTLIDADTHHLEFSKSWILIAVSIQSECRTCRIKGLSKGEKVTMSSCSFKWIILSSVPNNQSTAVHLCSNIHLHPYSSSKT